MHNYKHSVNQQFQDVGSCSIKNVKTIDARLSCPSHLSTSTLPRSGMNLQTAQLGCQQIARSPCGVTDHAKGVSSQSMAVGQLGCRQMQSPGERTDGGGLQYGTLGRMQPRADEGTVKIRRDLRASASDLSDRKKKNSSNSKNKQESAV